MDGWLDLVAEAAAFHKGRLTSASQFEASLDMLLSNASAPVTGIQFVVETPPHPRVTLGKSGKGKKWQVTHTLSGERGGSLTILQFSDGSFADPERVDKALMQLFEAHWKAYLRTSSAGLIDFKRLNEAAHLAARTVQDAVDGNGQCAVIYCDLDNFKKLNPTQDVGDRCIRECGAIIESAGQPTAVPIHDGGDEFLIVAPAAGPVDALEIAWRVAQAVANHDFKVPGVQTSICAGIATRESADGFEALRKLAQGETTKAKKAAGGRGRARFPASAAGSIDHGKHPSPLAACATIAKSNAGEAEPFANAWMGFLSRGVATTILAGETWQGLADEVARRMKWAALDVDPSNPSQSHLGRSTGSDGSTRLNPIDVAAAIAHGVYRGLALKKAKPISLTLRHDANLKALDLRAAKQSLWSYGGGAKDEFTLGPSWTNKGAKSFDSRRCVLIYLDGYKEDAVPNHLPFYAFKSILVDYRPTFGGGLPDFWEATVASLVDALQENPNISDVFVFGDETHARKTVENLRRVKEWAKEPDLLAARVGLPVGAVRDAGKRLRGRVHFPGSVKDLLIGAYAVAKKPFSLRPPRSSLVRSRGIMRQTFDLGEQALGREDGCRVGTIKQAYPIILEIARKSTGRSIHDQAGLKQKELVDFKVVLGNPLDGMIPEFYANEERDFQNYFDREFMSKGGRFFDALTKGKQLERVLAHVVKSIVAGKGFATRRAVLVVPHAPTSANLQPLGLVSIRIMPRFEAGSVVLNYSFIWRTVEALVGFPYSLYGSVRYSQELTKRVTARVPAGLRGGIRLGFVSYIANSLHFFDNAYGNNIARTIVNDAGD